MGNGPDRERDAPGEGSASAQLTAANLPLADAARLFALADALCAIGALRSGARAGQFSVHNFFLRAAYETAAGATARSGEAGVLVVLMRAGVLRRHRWHARFRGTVTPPALELAGPMDRDWRWRPDVDEIYERLAPSRAWQEAVGRGPAVAAADWEARLRAAVVRGMAPNR